MATYTTVGKPVDGASVSRRFSGCAAPQHRRFSRLRALVLLSGVVRGNGWTSKIGRSVLDLPVESGRSLLTQWHDQAVNLAAIPGVSGLSVQVLVDRSSPMPVAGHLSAMLATGPLDRLRVERDPEDYRGTGGLLRDLSRRYGDDDYLLVASGAQILTEPLEHLVAILASRSPDIAVVGHEDGTPAGFIWVRCGCLRAIPEVGFIDLKEQALPEIARRHHVAVVKHGPAGRPLRTPAEYVHAVRQYHLRNYGDERRGDPFAEGWSPVFSIVEPCAQVDPSAHLHDSVVLRGGRVERGAVVVRSVVGPGAVVRRGRTVVDAFMHGAGRGEG